MNNDSQDNDLRSAFQQLRAVDARAARDFETALVPRGSWRVRQGTIGAGLVCAAVAVSLLIFINAPRQVSPIAELPALEEIAFDECSESIDRELAVLTVSEWRSPTSFLLNPES